MSSYWENGRLLSKALMTLQTLQSSIKQFTGVFIVNNKKVTKTKTKVYILRSKVKNKKRQQVLVVVIVLFVCLFKEGTNVVASRLKERLRKALNVLFRLESPHLCRVTHFARVPVRGLLRRKQKTI